MNAAVAYPPGNRRAPAIKRLDAGAVTVDGGPVRGLYPVSAWSRISARSCWVAVQAVPTSATGDFGDSGAVGEAGATRVEIHSPIPGLSRRPRPPR